MRVGVRASVRVCAKKFFNEHECLAIIGGHTRIQIARLCEHRTRMQRSRSDAKMGFPDKVLAAAAAVPEEGPRRTLDNHVHPLHAQKIQLELLPPRRSFETHVL